MIFETYYWQLELKRLARKLRGHMAQKRWLDASDASVEKCIMLGFYSVRKTLEAFHPPPNMSFDIAVATFPRNKEKLSPICFPDVTEAFDLNKHSSEIIELRELCNQIIHSYYFSVWLNDSSKLKGVFFCSDRLKNKKIYRIDMSVIVSLFEKIASSHHKVASFVHLYPDHNRVIM